MTAATDLRQSSVAGRSSLDVAAGLKSIGRWAARNAIAIATVGIATGVFALRSVWSHSYFRTGSFDLGIFSQGVRGYAEGTGPISALKGPGYNLLGDHFSPIQALLGPLYLVFPSVVMLLVVQAFLVALGAAPLVAWARRDLGRWPALAIGVVFTTSFGVASAIGFDYHEVAWAVPMLSWSLCALAQGRFRLAAAVAAPLVLVKEDLGITVAAIGAVMFLRGTRRLGLVLAAFGLLATAIEVKVIIPLFNTAGTYDYSSQAGALSLRSVAHQIVAGLDVKAMTLVVTLSVGAFLATRSTLVLIALPTLAWRFLGSNPFYWETGHQYSLVLMPIVVAAFVDVLVRTHGAAREKTSFVRWALVTAVSINLLVGLDYPLRDLLRPWFWQHEPKMTAMALAVDLVPAGSTVAATNSLVPHLTDTSTVSLLASKTLPIPATNLALPGTPIGKGEPQWIVADTTDAWPEPAAQRQAFISTALRSGYTEVFSSDGIVVLHESDRSR